MLVGKRNIESGQKVGQLNQALVATSDDGDLSRLCPPINCLFDSAGNMAKFVGLAGGNRPINPALVVAMVSHQLLRRAVGIS